MARFLVAALLFSAINLSAQQRVNEAWVERTLRSLTVDEKIGQLLVPPVAGGFRNVESPEFDIIRRNLTDFHLGGYHVFGYSSHRPNAGGDAAGVALLVHDMQRTAKVPLLITADFEGGVGYVIPGATRFPLAMALGATGSEELSYAAGKATAEEGRALGVNVDFYPVVDVQNNPANPIINIRSFGENPAKVSSLSTAYIRGVQDGGMLATAKHFPGHGDVSQDSHLELPVLSVDRARLDSVELPPFRAAIDAGVAAVMSAHIYLPTLDKETGLPATLSRNALTGLLREDLGFKGLIFTDALDMHGVTLHFTNEEAAVRSVEAGADVVLFPPDVERAFNGLKAAVTSGRITEARLNESVRQILRAKARLGLDKYRAPDMMRLSSVVGRKAHRDLSQTIADRAVTLVRDEKNAVPLKLAAGQRLLHINLLDNRMGWREGPVGRVLAAELPLRYPGTTTVQLDDQSSAAEFDMTRRMADLVDAVVVTAFIRVAAYKGSIDLTRQQTELLKQLSAINKPFVFVLFGSPYLLHHIPELPSYMVTYDIHPGAEMAAVKAIAGEIPVQGKLPISLPGLYPVGHGLTR
ncbi:MAG TPA: glycoside hydrolase family 3 N-terminal domain-containing protein [Thermoanaerobaculia bacterium]|nr:glycoside hydrolase family 3 N-terminal domain-containing protein [Thermoanaerobaculia bacterium]